MFFLKQNVLCHKRVDVFCNLIILWFHAIRSCETDSSLNLFYKLLRR